MPNDRTIRSVYLTVLLVGIGYGASTGVLSIHLESLSISSSEMGWLAALFALGIVAFSIPAGWMLARWSPKSVLAASLIGYALAVGIFGSAKTFWAIVPLRMLDGACSVVTWIAAETILLARARKEEKAKVMSFYALAMALGYVIGPLLAKPIVKTWSTAWVFRGAGAFAVMACLIAMMALPPIAPTEETESGMPVQVDSRAILLRIKTSCFATFSYGYFQASVVLFLPLFLMNERHIEKSQTILITAFFALGMLIFANFASRVGDRFGHLRVMRVLGVVGGLMVASFVVLTQFWLMCVAVFIAGATLASLSPLSLALQGVCVRREELARAGAFYNAFYAMGMLLGPIASGMLFDRWGGGPMLGHLAVLWALFVLLTVVFAADDPHVHGALPRAVA